MHMHLRVIALSVEEREPGRFVWCLHERTGDPVVFEPIADMGASPASFGTYVAALVAGHVAWLRLVGGDTDRGPRIDSEDENADPVGVRVTASPLLPPAKLSRRSGSGNPEHS